MNNSIYAYSDYRQFLLDEYSKRKEHNPAYSMRAYARDISLSSGQLSEVLNHIHGLSAKKAKSVAEALGFNSQEIAYFCDLTVADGMRGSKKRILAMQRTKSLRDKYHNENELNFDELNMDTYKVISDWHYYALLELTEINEFQNNLKWLSKRLGLKSKEVQNALERLKRLGLLKEEHGQLIDTKKNLTSTHDVSSQAIQKNHNQILNKAKQALTEQKLLERDFSSIVFSFDRSEIQEAKTFIKDFRREFGKRFSKSKNKDSVYTMAIQLFSLDKPGVS